MIRAPLALAATCLASPALSQTPPPGPPVVIEQTLSGQPIRAADGDLRVTISQSVIPAGGKLPPHKHPYPRLVQVLAGSLKVTNLDTGQVSQAKAGDWMVDAVEQWHEAQALGDEPVRLLTVDQAPPGAATTILRRP